VSQAQNSVFKALTLTCDLLFLKLFLKLQDLGKLRIIRGLPIPIYDRRARQVDWRTDSAIGNEASCSEGV